MTGVRTSYRRSGEFRRRSGEFSKLDAAGPYVVPRTPTPPQHTIHARGNVRRHLLRATTRVAGLLLSDILTLSLAGFFLDGVREARWWGQFMSQAVQSVFRNGYLNSAHYALAVVIGLAVMGTYGKGDKRRTSHLVLLGVALGTGLQLWDSLWSSPLVLTITRYVLTVVSVGAMLAVSRFVLDAVAKRIRPLQARLPRVVMIGLRQDCERMRFRSAATPGFEVVEVIATDEWGESATAVHPLDELEYRMYASTADTALICGYPGSQVVQRVMRAAMSTECQVLSWNPSFDVSGAQPTLIWRAGLPLMEWRAPALRWWQMIGKRALDVAVSSVALIVFAPVIAVLGIMVKLDSPGPAVFGQPRLGRFGRVFRCFKMRSMYADAEQRLRSDPALYADYVQNDYKLPPERDNRITPIGRFLRKTSLDELPQLWNVLKGDMSLVGPRPIVPEELEHYRQESPLFLSLRPGMTGAWQVGGRSAVAYPERSGIELEYIQGWSLMSDLGILARTVPAVARGLGAH
jgi:exopolysaccharide production protein ExoY